MSLNYLAEISKSAYVAMLGTQENFKETYIIESIDEKSCKSSGCPLENVSFLPYGRLHDMTSRYFPSLFK